MSYSQYSQFSGGYPQQQQQTISTQQNGLTWNGSAWVTATPHHSGPGQPQHQQQYSSATTTPANSNLVQLYTRYYHEYTRLCNESNQQAQQNPANNSEFSRQAAWYQHYAHQASAAAHYYHNQEQNNSPSVAPPPLPPAPPTFQNGGTPASTVNSSRAPQPRPTAPTAMPVAASTQPTWSQPAASSSGPPLSSADTSPDSLKRFVHKCLMGVDVSKRDKMQELIQQTIAEAIQSNTLHTTNWDSKPILKLASDDDTGATSSSNRRKRTWDTVAPAPPSSSPRALSSSSYYGPAANTPASAEAATTSYYGPIAVVPSNRAASAQSTSTTSYYGPSDLETEVKSAARKKKKKKVPSSKASQDSMSSYYGPSASSSFDPNDDFVSLSSASSSSKKKKKNATSAHDGLDKSSSALMKRASRFSGPGGINESMLAPSRADENVAKYMGLSIIGGKSKLDEADYEHMKVKGTCTTLEKDYLRLTAPPRAELVRPQYILRRHLENLKDEWWNTTEGQKRRDYEWFCSQLKAIRQDLTVQQISNTFAVDVYETHARMALEQGDLNEYNQCQTQLRELYKSVTDSPHCNEFVAYRILYYVFLTGNKKYREGSKDIFEIMLRLTPEQQEDESIAHALQVRVAVGEYDYHAFFRLYKKSHTSHGVYLMNFMIPNVRQSALYRIGKAYRPSVSKEFVLAELGFDPEQVVDGDRYLMSCGCVLEGTSIVTKDSVIRESDLKDKKSSLI